MSSMTLAEHQLCFGAFWRPKKLFENGERSGHAFLQSERLCEDGEELCVDVRRSVHAFWHPNKLFEDGERSGRIFTIGKTVWRR